MAALLDIRDLKVQFRTDDGWLHAVDGVDIAVERGETVSVVGESGCGKTVTAMTVLRLVPMPPGRIAGGQVLWQGKDLVTASAEEMRRVRAKEIAIVFQEPMTSLNPVYSVGEQIAESLRLHEGLGRKAAMDRAVEMLALVRIPTPERRVHDYPHQFSGGMRQRVVISLALAANPKLIIADEPTTALDVSIQAQIITLLKKLGREHGTAVMLITHDMGVIAETADRVAVMYAGRIAEIGPVAEVIHHPQHPYTIGLMGAIPSVGDNHERLSQIDGSMPRLTAIPAGCAFNPRCTRVNDVADHRCTIERPSLLPAGKTMAACWLHDRLGQQSTTVNQHTVTV